MTPAFTLRHPTLKELSNRDHLLEATMREHPASFGIAKEYPLVLAPNSLPYSYGAWDQDQLVGHANLFPRVLSTADGSLTLPVALIGNVATTPNLRGKGYASHLIKQLLSIAEKEGAVAAFLWSDLPQFYQKLGFHPHGEECRFVIPRPKELPPQKVKRWYQVQETDLSDEHLQQMLRLRPKTPMTLQRSLTEMRELLRIPQTYLFMAIEGQTAEAFFIIGRGSDLQGVVHEWGALSAARLIEGVQLICHAYDLDSLILLTPNELDQSFHAPLRNGAREMTKHWMALVKVFDQALATNDRFQKAFIWGMDSI